MGNSPNERQGDNIFQSLEQEYEQTKQDPRGYVLMNKRDQNFYLLKEYTFCNELIFKNKEKELLEEVKQGIKQYLVSPIRIEPRIYNSFCSTSYKIYAIFEYPQVTLREEICARQKENKHFEEGELWSILQSCTNALSQLKPLVSLNSGEIFIDPEGHLKIIHNDLVDENYRAVLNEQIYYAPEKINNFNRLDSELGLRKEAIFSMGMTILEAAQLGDVSSCYNYQQCKFQEDQMMEMIELLADKYSAEMIEILANILQPNPNRRASLMEVQKVLDNYWNLEEEQGATDRNFQNSKDTAEADRASNTSRSVHNPLNEKNLNEEWRNDKASLKESISLKQKQPYPVQLPSYRLQQPTSKPQSQNIPYTPKHQPSVSDACLYTDPKLLEMIRKDLEDISRIKQSAFYDSSKYTYMYPQTQSILNSIKNLNSQSKVTPTYVAQFGATQPLEEFNSNIKNFRGPEDFPKPNMMKKKENQLVYTVESYVDGRTYEGTTLHGVKHGQGKLIFEDGAYYEGEFKNGKMDGQGTLYYQENRPAYEGNWFEDQFHGKGILYNECPHELNFGYDFHDMCELQSYWIRYEGEFHFDNKQGRGTLFLTNGEKFEGDFANDNVNGYGRYTTLNGQKIQGYWQDNKYVKDS